LETAEKEKLIDHLTKEIEVQNNNMMTFRTRANLPVFLGPFIVLGSVVIGQKQIPQGITMDTMTFIAIGGLAASYLGMGLAAAHIELSMAKQCNKWRDLITKIVTDDTTTTEKIQAGLKYHPISYRGYMAVYFAMFVGFICVLTIILRLTFPVPPAVTPEAAPANQKTVQGLALPPALIKSSVLVRLN
jgi:hypothetical protein